MDLKDVIEQVNRDALEGLNAFHAGHHDVTEKYLYDIEKQVVEYLRVPATPAEDVTESATIETPDATEQEKPAEVFGGPEHLAALDPVYGSQKPAEVPGAPAQPGAVDPAAAAQQIGKEQPGSKPAQ